MRAPLIALWVLCAASACGTGEPAASYPDPTAGFAGHAGLPDAGTATGDGPGIDASGDASPPTVAILAPLPAAVFDAPVIELRGDAGDDLGLARVEVRVGEGSWRLASLSAPGRAKTAFSLQLALKPGANLLTARAVDHAGKTAQAQVEVYLTRVIDVLAHGVDEAGSPFSLTLNRAQLQALIPEAKAAELTLYYLDVRPLLLEALEAVKHPAAYGVDTKAWGTAEWNMQRVITMQPDNTDLKGTSFEKMATVASALGVPVPTMLAQISDIAPTDAYLKTKDVAGGIFRTVLATHPGMKVDPADGVLKVPITLLDAFEDLANLDKKLGPSGAHPGVLYDATPSKVLMPDFEMTITGQSNLAQYEGVDLSGGKAWLLYKDPKADVVTFDFLDDKTFKVKGIADEPQVDLFFRVGEHKGFVSAGSVKGANPVDGFPKGAGDVWKLPPWTYEHMVVDAVYYAYRELHAGSGYAKTLIYDVGTLKAASKATWDKGWLTITTVAGIGSPPPPAYWWEMVAELAQVRLHDGGLQEGDANLRLPVSGVTVPVTAKEIIDSSRGLFEAQKSKLAAASLGDHSQYDTACDLFAIKLPSGMLSLHFAAPTDRPGATSHHAKPGLFADAALTTKLSVTGNEGSGDSTREKLVVPPTGTVNAFAADVDGRVWSLAIRKLDTDRVRIRLAPAAGAPK